jgi:dTDP-glucose 4,6-dehydratase/UDP-glucose 4-epimerase
VYQTAATIPTDETVALRIPDPRNPRYSYAGGKIISELLALHGGRESLDRVVVCRPHNVYGRDMGWEHVIPEFAVRMQRLLGRHATAAEIPFRIQGTGTETRAFTHVDDFTAGLLTIIEKGEHLGIYHVGSMEEVAIGDLAIRIARHLGARIRLVAGPIAPGSSPRRCPDTTKLRDLGWAPRVSLAQGLVGTVDWYAAHESLALEALVD